MFLSNLKFVLFCDGNSWTAFTEMNLNSEQSNCAYYTKRKRTKRKKMNSYGKHNIKINCKELNIEAWYFVTRTQSSTQCPVAHKYTHNS